MLVELEQVRRALEEKSVVPYFQPLLELRTGCLAGFEVLARWRHPEGGILLPKNFVSLAENNGLIDELSQQIMCAAFAAAKAVPAPLSLSVNVSPLQLQNMNLPGRIFRAAEANGFPLDRVTIELTESAMVGDIEMARQVARELKAAGCRLALDDFGTGYSNLSHLQAFGFDELKVDGAFVQRMTKTRESRKIVAAIIGLGQSLGMMTVAEGVETEEQGDMLLWLGCELGQGWLYGRPLPQECLASVVAAPPRPRSTVVAPGDDWAVSSLEALPTQRLAQLQAIYDGAPVGLCFVDRNFRYVSVNQRLAEINGLPIAAHLGRTVQQTIPASFPSLEPYLNRALLGESISAVEIPRPALRDGEPGRTMRASYQPAWDEADEVIGISIAVEDISEQKRAQQFLRETQEARWHADELNSQLAWMMDAEGNQLVSSRWVVQATGLNNISTRNLGWLEALHEDDLEPTMKTMRECLRSGKPIDIEYRVLTPDGRWKWMRSRGSPRMGSSGQIVRWYGIVEDIDRRKMTDTLISSPEPSSAC